MLLSYGKSFFMGIMGAFVLTGTGCGVTDQVRPAATKDIDVQSGIVVFASQEVFNKEFTTLLKDQVNAKEWGNQMAGFTSFLSNYEKTIAAMTEADWREIITKHDLGNKAGLLTFEESDDEQEIVRSIREDVYGAIANQDGMYQIGNTLIKRTHDASFEISADAPDAVSILKSVTDETQTIPTTVRKVSLGYQSYSSSLRGGNNLCDIPYSHSGKNYRFKGQIDWSGGCYGITLPTGETYCYNEVITWQGKHQKKVLGVWVAEDAPAVEMKIYAMDVDEVTSDGSSVVTPIVHISGFTASWPNVNSAGWTLVNNGGDMNHTITNTSKIDVESGGKGEDLNNRYCWNNWWK